MISVEEALQILADHTVDFGTETLDLEQAMHRVLKEPLFSDRPLPPYDRVTMDGIAINFDTYKSGARIFPIMGVAAAGMAQMTLQDANACLEVMTGSILPLGTDTVIRYEDIELSEGQAKLLVEGIAQRQNIHYQGQDRQAGDLIVPMNQQIAAPEIGVAASTGKATVLVGRLPKTMVISTGDELVEIDQQPLKHQIRRSNVYRIKTTLEAYGIQADTDHIIDDKAAIHQTLSQYLEDYDVIILSGGVSKGKFDFLPEVLSELGVTKLFHRIRQKPGKPFWFGQVPGKCTVFGFPGNPVSSFLCYHRYFKTWLDLSCRGALKSTPNAKLDANVSFKPDLTYYLEVALSYSPQGEIIASPKKGNGSGDLANLADADAFIELPRGRDHFKAGEVFPIYIYR